jgi:hypothetical protein
MRFVVVLSLSAFVGISVGCGSPGRDQTSRSVPRRDLTLVSQASAVTVASAVERQQVRPQRAMLRPAAPKLRPLARNPGDRVEPTVRLAGVSLPAPLPPGPEPVETPTPVSDRELLPGKTVTVIPASSGPSSDGSLTGDLPPEPGRVVSRGGHSGGGRGRGPGIGIARAPRPDFR